MLKNALKWMERKSECDSEQMLAIKCLWDLTAWKWVNSSKQPLSSRCSKLILIIGVLPYFLNTLSNRADSACVSKHSIDNKRCVAYYPQWYGKQFIFT